MAERGDCSGVFFEEYGVGHSLLRFRLLLRAAMAAMIGQRFLAMAHHLARLRVGDEFLIPILCGVDDSLQEHPFPSVAAEIIARLPFQVGFPLAPALGFVAESGVQFERLCERDPNLADS